MEASVRTMPRSQLAAGWVSCRRLRSAMQLGRTLAGSVAMRPKHTRPSEEETFSCAVTSDALKSGSKVTRTSATSPG